MEALKVVTAPEQATVEHAGDLAEELRKALREARQVLLNLSRVERIDTSFVHIIYGARRMAIRDGTAFHLSGTVTPAVCEALRTGGFCETVTTDARELEQQLVDFPSEEQEEEDSA
jgi:anti-anti-sigma regulatory factor